MKGIPFSAVAAAKLSACRTVKAFIERHVNPVVRAAVDRRNPLQDTAAAYLDRVSSWLRSLGKLDQLSDFQAVDAGARSLFEIVVDLTLLKHDPKCPVQKMLDWELCARYRRFQQRLGVHEAMSGAHAQQLAMLDRVFIEANAQLVTDVRARWEWKRDPMRWTGRNLFDDAECCDELSATRHAQHYRLRHTDLCWNTHGSAFAGIRGLDEAAITVGVAQGFDDATILARAAAELVLDLLDCLDNPMICRFEDLDDEIRRAEQAILRDYILRRVQRRTSARETRVEATRVVGALWRPAAPAHAEWKTYDARHSKRRRTTDLVLVLSVNQRRLVRVLKGNRSVWVDPSEFEDVALPRAEE